MVILDKIFWFICGSLAHLYYISFLSGYGNLDNQSRETMNNNKDCQVGQLTSGSHESRLIISDGTDLRGPKMPPMAIGAS